MTATSIYPVVMTEEVAPTAAFYRDHFGFEPTFETDWYASLRRGPWELAVLDVSHDTVPRAYRSRVAGGLVLNFEVDDVGAEYRRLVVGGPLRAVLPLRSEAFGQRHFIVAGPDDVLIDVITPIEPDTSFAAHFTDAPAGA